MCASGTVIMSCLNNEIVNEYLPLPKDSKVPEMTILTLETIKQIENILKPIIPIFSKELVALNHDKINLGKVIKISVPLHRITEVTIIETLIIF